LWFSQFIDEQLMELSAEVWHHPQVNQKNKTGCQAKLKKDTFPDGHVETLYLEQHNHKTYD
jgi:hypothetical protein